MKTIEKCCLHFSVLLKIIESTVNSNIDVHTVVYITIVVYIWALWTALKPYKYSMDMIKMPPTIGSFNTNT